MWEVRIEAHCDPLVEYECHNLFSRKSHTCRELLYRLLQKSKSFVAGTLSQTERQTESRTDGCGRQIRRSFLHRKEGLITSVSCEDYM
jgi:hypothetical protein